MPIFQKNVQTSLISKINTNNCKKKNVVKCVSVSIGQVLFLPARYGFVSISQVLFLPARCVSVSISWVLFDLVKCQAQYSKPDIEQMSEKLSFYTNAQRHDLISYAKVNNKHFVHFIGGGVIIFYR